MLLSFILLLAGIAGTGLALTQPGLHGLLDFALPLVLAGAILLAYQWVTRRAAPQATETGTGRRYDAKAPAGRAILIDGSNVLHWQDNVPSLVPLHDLIAHLQSHGFSPGVVFDASAGYKIGDRYLDDADFARILNLPAEHVLVVPKGTQADAVLLEAARDQGAPIISDDRFRDWTDRFPEIATPGHLLRGGYRNGALWLDPLPQPSGTARPPRSKA